MSFLKNLSSGISNFFSAIFNSIGSLIKSFINKFKKPYHSSTLSIRGLLHSIAVAVAVFVFLFILQPFGLKEVAESEKMMVISICSSIAFVAMILFEIILPFVLKSFYDEHHWTGGKQLVQSLLMTFFILLGVFYYLNSKNIGDGNFPTNALTYFAYCIIPLVLFIFVQESMHDSKFKRKADNLNSDLKTKNIANAENPLKILIFKGSGEKLSLIPNQLIYAKIGKSTTEFYYQNPFGIDKSIINMDEKEVRTELGEHPQFIKFSDNIVINANAIQKVEGSARGYDVAIARVNEMVKVSNRFRKNLENL